MDGSIRFNDGDKVTELCNSLESDPESQARLYLGLRAIQVSRAPSKTR